MVLMARGIVNPVNFTHFTPVLQCDLAAARDSVVAEKFDANRNTWSRGTAR